jgi:cell division protein FtsB
MAAAHRIRWDRLGRWALLCVLVGVLYLYIGPTRAWVSAQGEAARKRAEVAALQERNAELQAERARLRSADAIEREARRLGMVRAGERAYVVEGLTPPQR